MLLENIYCKIQDNFFIKHYCLVNPTVFSTSLCTHPFFSLLKDDVFWFEVSVNNPHPVEVRQC